MTAVKAPKRLRFPGGSCTDCATKKPIAPKAMASTILVTLIAFDASQRCPRLLQIQERKINKIKRVMSTFGNSTLIAHRPSSTSFTCQRNVPLAVLMVAEQKSDAVFADVCVACKLGAMSQVVI